MNKVGPILLACATIFTTASAQTLNANDSTIVRNGPVKTWPAGPYSQVATNYGILTTTIPLINLKGKGNTALELALVHRTATNGNIPNEYAVGKAWSHTGVSYLNTSDGIVRYIANRAVSKWTVNSGNFDRKPGVRDDLSTVSGGYKVVDYATKSSYFYDRAVGSFYYLTKVVDVFGNQVTYTYAGSTTNISRITDASGRYVDFSYDTTYPTRVNRIHLQTTSSFREWDFSYVTLTNGASTLPNYLDTITFPPTTAGGTRPTIEFDCDVAGRVTFLRTLSGKLWGYTYGTSYSGLQGLTKINQPSKTTPTTIDTTHFTSLVYGFNGAGGGVNDELYCRITDPMGSMTSHNYWNYTGNQSTPDFPYPIKRIGDPPVSRFLDPRNNQNPVTWYWTESYHWRPADANCDVYTNREGIATNYTFDSTNRGLVGTKTTINQGVTFTDTYTYFGGSFPYTGKVSQHVDPLGTVTTYGYYNTTGALAFIAVDPSGQNLTRNFQYNATGQLTDEWSGSDPHTVYSNFDAYGNPKSVASPTQGTTSYLYDDYNNMTSQAEPSPKGTTTYTYDLWNRRLRTTYPDAQFTLNTYDNEGNVTSFRKENGSIETTTYNFLNLPAVKTVPVDGVSSNNLITTTDYDYNGRKASITAPDGILSTFTYNARGDLIRVLFTDGTSRQWGYNGNGDILWRQNGRLQITYYTYDDLARLTAVDYQSAATPDVTYQYRKDGLRAGRTDTMGTTVWTYNSGRQLIGVSDAATGKNLAFTYQPNTNRIATMATTSNTWSYFYDANTRPLYLRQTVSGEVERIAAYNSDGSVARREYPNNTKKEYTYDNRGRLTSLRHAVTSLDLLQEQISYVYSNGNVSQYDMSINGGASYGTTYTHDQAGRLLTEIRTDSTGNSPYNKGYTYTKGGDRASTVRNNSSSFYTYFGSSNKLKTGEGFTVTAYDNDGNPTAISVPNSGNWTLTYDEENRLTQVSAPGGTSSFRYDGDGQRVQRSTPTSTFRYLIHNGNVILTTTNAPALTIQAFYTPGVGYFKGGQVFYYQDNGLGSSLVVRNTTGDWMSLTEYDAYGVEYALNGIQKSDLRFAGLHGYITDDATGMDWVGSRFYLPILGRFLTQNSADYSRGSNLYSYADNNPLLRTQTDGKSVSPVRLFSHWPPAFTMPTNRQTFEKPWPTGWGLTPNK